MGASAEDRHQTDTSRLLGRLVFGGALAIGLVYAIFFAVRLPVLPLEQSVGMGALGYRALHAALMLAPDPIAAGRTVAVVCLVAAIAATARFCTRATGDAPLGGTLALIWIVFPPVVGIAVLSVPYSLAMATISIALCCLWPGAANTDRADAIGAVATAVAALTDPLGAWAAMACALVIVIQRRRIWPLFGPAVGAALAVIATVPVAVTDLPGIPTTLPPLIAGAALPYSLVWAGCVLGAFASRSGPVQAALGRPAVVACRVAPVLYAGLVALQVRQGPTAILVAGAVFLPFGLIGCLPLAVWVRRVMPTVRALAAWIAFPVLMYCGFWLILGPVKHDRYPYAALPQPMSHTPAVTTHAG